MIEQTELVLKEWIYIPPSAPFDSTKKIVSQVGLDVMKKTAPTKKGIACRFTCKFTHEKDTILLYVAEDTYVIDPEDSIDKNELLRMLRNSYSKFKETFEFRKLGTVLQDVSMRTLDESKMDLNALLPLLN